MVVAVGEGLVVPVGLVADFVVVAAEGGEVGWFGGSPLAIGDLVVEVGVGGGHATAGEYAVGIGGFDLATVAGGGASAGDAVVDDLAGFGISHSEAPLAFVLLLGDLAGDVGDYGPVAGEFSGVVVELGEGGEVDVNIDGASPGGVPG